MFDSLKQKAQAVQDQINQTFELENKNESGSNYMDKLKNLQNQVESGITKVQQDVKKTVVDIDKAIQEPILKKKKEINVWIRKKVEDAVIELVEKARPAVKQSIKDPEMFDCVKNWVDEGVDQAWPILMEEVKYKLHTSLMEEYVEIQNEKVNFLCLPCKFIRTKYLYSTQPYDRSVWYNIKTFWYWFFVIVSAMPVYGIQPLFYVFIFLCIDKSDEYQLTQYVLNFKKMQFVTQGCINAVIGYIQYYICVNLNEKPLTIVSECFDNGPGSQIRYIYDLVVYLTQILLVWTAFFMLPCSKQKGKAKLKYDDVTNKIIEADRIKTCSFNCSRGGALQTIMIWEFINFGICIAVFLLSMGKMEPYSGYSQFSDYAMKPNPYFYFCLIIYGLLSFPFLIFAVGPLGSLLTRSRPTGYDKYGNTVPLKKNIKIDYQKNDELSNALNIDIEEMFD